MGSIESEPDRWLEYMVEPSTLESFFQECSGILKVRKDKNAICSMADSVTEGVDKVWASIEHEQPDYACRKGCSWCCHQNVSVSWPELLQVLAHLRNEFVTERLENLGKKCRRKANEIAGKSTNQRFDERVACAFLEDGICIIHSARPLQCRGGFSEEETFCRNLIEDRVNTQKAIKNGYQRGRYLIAPKLIYNSAQAAMIYAMKEAGLDASGYELTVAMAILLENLCDGMADAIGEDDLRPALLNKQDDDIMTSALSEEVQ